MTPPAMAEEQPEELGRRIDVLAAAQTAETGIEIQRRIAQLSALVEELYSWDVYLERLQVKVATTAGDRRDQAEGAIRQLRRQRNTLGAGMAEVASTSGEWYEVREHVKHARNELESRAAEVEATLQKGSAHNATMTDTGLSL